MLRVLLLSLSVVAIAHAELCKPGKLGDSHPSPGKCGYEFKKIERRLKIEVLSICFFYEFAN